MFVGNSFFFCFFSDFCLQRTVDHQDAAEDVRAMSNSRPTLLPLARRSPTMVLTQHRGTGNNARAQYITRMSVEYGFVSRSLVDLDRDPGAEAALRFRVHDSTGKETKEQMVSTEYQLQVLGIHWNIGPITTSRSGSRVNPFMTGTSEIDNRSGGEVCSRF